MLSGQALRLGSRLSVWGWQCCKICLLQPALYGHGTPGALPQIPETQKLSWGQMSAHDESSRLVTWPMMLSAILCIATVSVQQIGLNCCVQFPFTFLKAEHLPFQLHLLVIFWHQQWFSKKLCKSYCPLLQTVDCKSWMLSSRVDDPKAIW